MLNLNNESYDMNRRRYKERIIQRRQIKIVIIIKLHEELLA